MSEISKLSEVKNEAWQFYDILKQEEAQLSQAIGNAGNPNSDPNSTSTQSS